MGLLGSLSGASCLIFLELQLRSCSKLGFFLQALGSFAAAPSCLLVLQVLLSRQERELRQLARKYGFTFLELDQLKTKFDQARGRKLGVSGLLVGG